MLFRFGIAVVTIPFALVALVLLLFPLVEAKAPTPFPSSACGVNDLRNSSNSFTSLASNSSSPLPLPFRDDKSSSCSRASSALRCASATFAAWPDLWPAPVIFVVSIDRVSRALLSLGELQMRANLYLTTVSQTGGDFLSLALRASRTFPFTCDDFSCSVRFRSRRDLLSTKTRKKRRTDCNNCCTDRNNTRSRRRLRSASRTRRTTGGRRRTLPVDRRNGFPLSSSSRTRVGVGRRPCCPIGTRKHRGSAGRRRFSKRLSRR